MDARANPLRKLCNAISDGKPVDWDLELSDPARGGSAFLRLKEIEAVALAHRAIAARLSAPRDGLGDAPSGEASATYWGALRLCEIVGRGSFGDVYRAIDTRLQREVALKLRRVGFTDSDQGPRRFLEEARKLARVRHPNVLTIHGADVHEQRVGFWTDFIRGSTLAARLQEEGPLAPSEAILIGLSLCGALAAVHAAGFIHGDVKAANVMRERGGRIVLMDFGAAQWRNDGGGLNAQARPVYGTPLVLAPEVLRGESAGPEADLYSLGALLFHLVTGRYPIEAASWDELMQKHAARKRTALREARPDLAADFVHSVEMALAPDPAERFGSAGEMERALFAALPSAEVPRDQVRTLRSLEAEIGRLPEEMARRIAAEAAKSLARIHADGGALGDFDLDGMLLLENGSLKLHRSGAAPEAPRDPSRLASLQRADLRRLGVLLHEAVTASGPALISPFFSGVLRQLEAIEESRGGPPITAPDLVRILSEGEKSPWWRERLSAIRRASRSPRRGPRISRETTLHGRDDDLRRLRDAFQRARSGDGAVVLLQGEAGIGKTRLVNELVCALEQDGEELSFLYGSYPPGGAATEAGAFRDAFRDHFDEMGLENGIGEALAAAPRLAEPFTALLRGEQSDSDPLSKDSLQTGFVHLIRALAADRPTILLIDDLHFAPEEGRGLFAALALSVPGHPILLIGATRPELPEAWTASLLRSEHAAQLALARLSDSDIQGILAEALRSDRLAEDLALLLARRCDGNPLFLLEHLHALEEAEYVVRGADGAWAVTASDREITTPHSIQQLIRARLAGLDREDRELLEIASCAGFEFDPSLVADAAGVAVLDALRRFGLMEKRHGLIRTVGRRYAFDHHQVQEALHAGLFEQLREHYHLALAHALETRERAQEKDPAELDGAVVVGLAEHFVKGGQGADAARYLLPALDHMERSFQQGAAAELATRALESPGFPAGAERIPVLKRLAARLEYLGRREQENAALEEMLGVAESTGDPIARARARRMLGWLRIREARYGEARAVLEEALELARGCGDIKEESNATAHLGNLCYETGALDQAEAYFKRSLELARQSGFKLQEVKVTGNLGVVAYGLGRLAEAHETFERHLEISREAGYRLGEAIAVGNLGVILSQMGRLDEAREHHERHLALAREVGFRQAEAIATGNIGGLDYNVGRLAASLQSHERMLRLSAEIGFRVGEASAMQGLALTLAALGRYDEARIWEERRLALAREIQKPVIEGEAHLGLGDLAFEAREWVEAERLYRVALEVWKGSGYKRGLALARVRLGRVCLEVARNDEANEHFSAGLALAREAVVPSAIVTASIESAFLPSGEISSALEAYAANEGRLNYLEKLRARFRLFQRTGDRIHLDEARRLLDTLRIEAPEADRHILAERVSLYREIEAA